MAAVRRHAMQAQARVRAQAEGQAQEYAPLGPRASMPAQTGSPARAQTQSGGSAANQRASGQGIGAALSHCFAGIGPTLGAELASAARLDPAKPAAQLGDAELSRIWETFSVFVCAALTGQTERFVFEAAFDRESGHDAAQAVAMSCGGLSHLADEFRIKRFASASDMIDTCYFRADERG